MLSYKELDNLASIEILIGGHVTTEQFDATAKKLEAFIARHKRGACPRNHQGFRWDGRGRFLARSEVQPPPSERFQPLRHRDQHKMVLAVVGIG